MSVFAFFCFFILRNDDDNDDVKLDLFIYLEIGVTEMLKRKEISFFCFLEGTGKDSRVLGERETQKRPSCYYLVVVHI